MSTYKIVKKQYDNAKRLGVTIKPSENKNKKIDVYDNAKKIASIGSIKYLDYHLYIKSEGKEYANKRQLLYRSRHAKTLSNIGSPSYYANQILWT